jgi:hypothetical protein
VVRCKYTSSAGGKGDVLIKDGQRKAAELIPPAAYGLSGTGTMIGTVSEANRFTKCDPWMFGLIMFPGKAKLYVTFDEFLAEASSVSVAKRIDEKGRPVVVVDAKHKLRAV